MPEERQRVLVELEDVRAAVAAVQIDEAAGLLTEAEATKQINACRRAVTPRDLWRASGGRFGSRKRSDWKDVRGAVYGLLFLLLLAVVGVYFITVIIGEYVGGEEVFPDPPSVSNTVEPSG